MSNQNKTDVLVVGMGMAGLMAAYTAAKGGKNVTLLGTGLGALSIASGCIDVLGYLQDGDTLQAVPNPLEALEQLPKAHPYSIIGRTAVENALQAMQELCTQNHAHLLCQGEQNTLVPTIIGTLKPTFFYPAASDSKALFAAKRVLVASVDAIRDCHPKLIVQQLQKYPALKHVEFSTFALPSHFGAAHRAVSPLDVARYVDSKEGFEWLKTALLPLAKNVDAILIPPILGTHLDDHTEASPWEKLQKTLQENGDCSLVEMISLPPGVGGYRLLGVLMRAIRALQAQGIIRIVENATITKAELENKHCLALIAHGEGVTHRYEAKNFILATGGILGGGIQSKPGKAYESILGIEIAMPAKVEDWAADSAFGSHAFTKAGVTVNENLQALDTQGEILADNVHFAGRTLGVYDFAAEKSGNGVALATAFAAAKYILQK